MAIVMANESAHWQQYNSFVVNYDFRQMRSRRYICTSLQLCGQVSQVSR